MTGMAQEVRPATMADHDALARVLARAFEDDPFLRWAFDRPARRERSSLRFFHWYVAQLIDQDVTWTTASYGGAAVWALPRQWEPSIGQSLRLVGGVATGVRHPIRLLHGLAQLERKHPEADHLYLALLGVDPSLQGQGTGSALIADGLQLADEERWPAYLESSNPANVAFYGRHGFEVIDRTDLPRGGPPIHHMWREPR